jgi:hypothetical protein
MLNGRINQQTTILALGDWLALGLFVFIGQLNHELVGENPLPRFLGAFAVLALPWTAVALLMGVYRLGDSGRGFFGRSLTAWLVGAPLALLIRALVNGQSTIIVSFMIVTLGLGGAFLLGWRVLFWQFIRRVKDK